MSLKNLLDLRKKTPAQIKIVERIIFQKRSLKSDIFLALSVILVASTIIWGISKADTQPNPKTNTTKSFSAIGIVSNITNTEISIVKANGTDEQKDASYTFSTIQATKIETKDYTPISLSDIKVGDKVIVQGVYIDDNIEIKRIVSFGEVIPKEETATTTATSTATSSEVSTTTDATSTSIINTVTDTVSNIIDTVKDTTQNIIDTITGTTSTSIDESIATTTEEVSTTSTTTDIATPEVTIPETTPAPVPPTESQTQQTPPPVTEPTT